MHLQIIKTENEYQNLLNWVDAQFNIGYAPYTAEGEKLQIALLLIKQYEDANYAHNCPNGF